MYFEYRVTGGDLFMDTQAYQNAKNSLKAQDYKAAERDFKKVLETIDEHNEQYNNVLSHFVLVIDTI